MSHKKETRLTAVRRCCLLWWERCYRYHYDLGVSVIRGYRRARRWLGRTTRPLRRWLRYQWVRLAVRPVHRFFHRQRMVAGRMAPAFRQLGEAAKKNVFRIFPCFWHLCCSAVRNYWEELTALGRLIGPVLAAVLLAVTLSSWRDVQFCLTVTYQGQELGLVESAAVYDRGATLARGRVINADSSFEVDAVPTFTMTLRRGKATLSDTEVCDAILRQSGDSIAQVSGLYVEGAFVAAMADEADIRRALTALKEGRYDKDDPNQRAEFVQAVEIVEGLYPISTVAEDADALSALLREETVSAKYHTVQEGDTLSAIAREYDVTTAELRQMNPKYADTDTLTVGEELLVRRARARLQVQVVKTVTETETIAHKSKTVYRDDKPVTYSKVTAKGKDGTKEVTYERVELDGELIEIVRVGEKVVEQPVTRVEEIGTKKVYTSGNTEVVQGDGIATGNWTWPVPVCHRVYQGYHRGHLAIDISSGPIPVLNKPCLAADGGKVVYAGWYYDYGYYVKIDHGNGLYTTYAHLNSIAVVAGQLVSNGQEIGRVGNTGYSTGPHLHFEVIKNGVKVNPLNYVSP